MNLIKSENVKYFFQSLGFFPIYMPSTHLSLEKAIFAACFNKTFF